ncbi:PEP/pyruvate-binding domain-containing protein [Thalassobaculum sp.]|uniref:PEP/pyruvate-binding domain-containing protein n=1 Tax=Thalassobaculum sp. TaxID=2022740 RepID=UPI0032EBA0CD
MNDNPTETVDDGFTFGTKAGTLSALRTYAPHIKVPDFDYFTVADWERSRTVVLDRLRLVLKDRATVAVRSSALDEDGGSMSMAGAYDSALDVCLGDDSDVSAAIDRVISSYGPSPSPANEVLVQSMVRDVEAAGVIFSRDLSTGAPYYAIAYDDESKRTDAVTGGFGAHKALYLHHSVTEHALRSTRVQSMLRLVRAVEHATGCVPIDIEFAIPTDGEPVLLQARRMPTVSKWNGVGGQRITEILSEIEPVTERWLEPKPGIVGRRSILGNMTDWNPAEMIGMAPRALAFSVYQRLVTKEVWRSSRGSMGYRQLPANTELMASLAGRPYIDIRASLNSFLPRDLDDGIAERLVDAEIQRVDAHPELHDRIEFEVAPTVLDFTTPLQLSTNYGHALRKDDRDLLLVFLHGLTRAMLDPAAGGTLARAEQMIRNLAAEQSAGPHKPWLSSENWARPRTLLGVLDTAQRGTFAFAILARHGFCAEAILRSAVARGAVAPERVEQFKKSIRTIAGDLTNSLFDVARGRCTPEDFFHLFGHVRPGSYDILSRRLDDRSDLFNSAASAETSTPEPFEASAGETAALNRLLAEANLGIDTRTLLEYAQRGIIGREFGKFVFTRNLSDFLEGLAAWGELHGFDRENLSHLSIEALSDLIEQNGHVDRSAIAARIEIARSSWNETHALRLSYLIRSIDELYIVPVHRSLPNFVGTRRVEGPVVVITNDGPSVSLHGSIVCIENADPGFDWIFTRGIVGLVTQFGGANSHMAIRCAEFGIPAAIGCGELLFHDIANARKAEIDGALSSVRVVA